MPEEGDALLLSFAHHVEEYGCSGRLSCLQILPACDKPRSTDTFDVAILMHGPPVFVYLAFFEWYNIAAYPAPVKIVV